MPCYCCIRDCNGNKPNGPRVSVFQFPKDPELLEKWLSALSGKNLQMTENSRVCQKHFKPEDIITETSAYDSKRKISITVPLKNFRLQHFAVPSIFEDYPAKQPKKVKKSPLKDSEEKDKNDSEVETSKQIVTEVYPLLLKLLTI